MKSCCFKQNKAQVWSLRNLNRQHFFATFVTGNTTLFVIELWLELIYFSVVSYVHQQGETLTYLLPVWLPPSNHLNLGLSICNTYTHHHLQHSLIKWLAHNFGWTHENTHFQSSLTPVCSCGDMVHSDPPCWGIWKSVPFVHHLPQWDRRTCSKDHLERWHTPHIHLHPVKQKNKGVR